MPKGSKVHKIYQAILRAGGSVAKAARISQWRTRKSLKTGKSPRKKS